MRGPMLLLCVIVPALTYFAGPATPRHGVRGSGQRFEATTEAPPRSQTGSFPSLKINEVFGIDNEYQLNLGKAIDTLRRDYPRVLTGVPDFSIFTENIRLTRKSGKESVEGMEAYARVFDVLRFIRNTTMVHDEVGARIVVSDGTIRVRWNAKLTMKSGFSALPGLTTRDEAGRPVVFVDGVSVYETTARGMVQSHQLEDVVVTPPELQGAVDLALFAWPGGFSPQVAMPTPYFRPAPMAESRRVQEAAWTVSAGSALAAPLELAPLELAPLAAPLAPAPSSATRAQPTGRRARALVATVEETPMERAARERAEDAEKARRLSELRSGKRTPKSGGGLLSRFLSAADQAAPQACESNYDCESPLVCCDLVVASVCCSSGMMIGPPQSAQPQLQRQAIPIPVPVDDAPRRRGGGGTYGPGNGFPTPQ